MKLKVQTTTQRTLTLKPRWTGMRALHCVSNEGGGGGWQFLFLFEKRKEKKKKFVG